MEEKFFTSTSNFFAWVQEVADKGGLKILTIGTHNDTYWVKYEVKVIAVQPNVRGQLIAFLRQQTKLHYVSIYENDFEFADKILKAINLP